MKDTKKGIAEQSEMGLSLEELIRRGARELIQKAIEVEVQELLALHKAIYAESDFQTVMHCWLPEADAHAYFRYPGEKTAADRIVPVDAEGGFQYLVIPVLPADAGPEALIRGLHDYKVAVIRGGGVWAAGHQSLSEVLHHPSSVGEICLYRIGAFERGLDLRRMEPAKAKKW